MCAPLRTIACGKAQTTALPRAIESFHPGHGYCQKGLSVVRIALACLFADRGKLITAVTGVTVATVLMLVQLGIYRGFADVASAPIRWIGGDLWVMSKDTRHLEQGAVLFAGSDAALRRHACVARIRPVIVQFTPFRRASGLVDMMELVGVDMSQQASSVLPWSLERGLPKDLTAPRRITLDIVNAEIAGKRDLLGAPLEVNGRLVHVGAVTRGLRSNFGLHPRSFTDARTAREILGLRPGEATFWVADLKDPMCAESVIASVETDKNMTARTKDAFVERTERELLESSGVGLALGFVALLGWAVAAVIVAQTLVASLKQHQKELGMLKALGARRSELTAFVAWQAGFFATTGAALGLAVTFVLQHLLKDLAVPVLLSPGALVVGVLLVFFVCGVAAISGARAVFRLPADEVLR